jgi:hypothetical protein
MRIELTPANSAKILAAQEKLDRSANEIVNLIIANLEEIEINEQVNLTPKPAAKNGTAPRSPIRRSHTYRMRW